MNCCDYDCNQGRDCPARKPAKVANVGQRMHDLEPLPPITWRDYMGDLARVMLLAICCMLLGAAITLAAVYA